MNWENLPYDHKGKWSKVYDSIMNPGAKVTWPQFIVEMTIFNRSKYLKTHPSITKGAGWSTQIQRQVRSLNQQSAVLCNYFEHPDDEPLVVPAFKNFFRNFRTMKIGQFRKVRSKGGRLTITQDEKDVVLGVSAELEKLKQQRKDFVQTLDYDKIQKSNPSFKTRTGKKSKLKALMDE